MRHGFKVVVMLVFFKKSFFFWMLIIMIHCVSSLGLEIRILKRVYNY